jgi:hypothetical protein
MVANLNTYQGIYFYKNPGKNCFKCESIVSKVVFIPFSQPT